jgi:predicted peroxiredoxin
MNKQANNQGYVFSITHFENDPDRVAVPLVLANNALAMGNEVLIWVTLEAVNLAKQGAAEGLQPKSFPAIAELLENFKANGGKIGVCPPCAKTHGVNEDNLVENANWMGAAAVLEQSQGRQSAWF